MKPLRIYLDNNITSAMHGRPLGNAAEQQALVELMRVQAAGSLEFRVSAESHRESGRTQDAVTRKRLMEGLHELPRVTTDHIIIGFSSQDMGYRGFVSAPLISDVIDEPMFAKLTCIGLDEADARHFVNAVHEECGIFLTTDPDFHNIRERLQELFPSIRIFTPTQLREFVTASQGGRMSLGGG